MLISWGKIIGLPYAHEISKILTLNNIDLREDLKAKMKESERLIDKSVLGKLSFFQDNDKNDFIHRRDILPSPLTISPS